MTATHRNIALVSDSKSLPLSTVLPVAAAMNTQVVRDFGPMWGISASVSAFADRASVPHGYWPIFVGSEGQNGGGVHQDHNRQPYALVDLTNSWSVAASHECLEMLADPFGVRTHSGRSIDPAYPGRVSYLLEVGDPCEADEWGYQIDGVTVTDFLTPHYWDNAAKPGLRYDFMGHLGPLQVLDAGYISWHRADGSWFQLLNFNGKSEVKSLGMFDAKYASIREWIDAVTRS